MGKAKQRKCRICKKRPPWRNENCPPGICKRCYHSHVWEQRRGQLVPADLLGTVEASLAYEACESLADFGLAQEVWRLEAAAAADPYGFIVAEPYDWADREPDEWEPCEPNDWESLEPDDWRFENLTTWAIDHSSRSDTAHPMLVYLYGPPACGKLTVAEQLAELSGYRLFHNHLTVNAVRSVFDFGTEPFNQLVRKLRLDILRAAASAGIDVIFTNSSAWQGPDGRANFAAFADTARRLAEAEGGSAFFVRLTAPLAVLEERVADESRRAHGKLLEVARLRDMVATLDQTSLYPGDLTIDTSQVTPNEAAQLIHAALRPGSR